MVSFPVAVGRGIKNCCTINVAGRSPRSEYWWFILFLIIFLFVATVLSSAVFGYRNGVAAITVLLTIVLAEYGLIIVGVRRLHDLNVSGLLILIPIIADIGMAVLSFSYVDPNLHTILSGVNSIIKLVFICVFCHKGTEGPNRYGPDPLAK